MKNGEVKFPAKDEKKQFLSPEIPSTFQRNRNMIVIKRIPAKSDERFINAAVYFAGQQAASPYISTHNKINFIDTKDSADEMCARLVYGLYGLLNSTIYDRYVSIVSKSKQINSKEMKALPLPPVHIIESIGARLMSGKDMSVSACDQIVNPTLHIRGK